MLVVTLQTVSWGGAFPQGSHERLVLCPFVSASNRQTKALRVCSALLSSWRHASVLLMPSLSSLPSVRQASPAACLTAGKASESSCDAISAYFPVLTYCTPAVQCSHGGNRDAGTQGEQRCLLFAHSAIFDADIASGVRLRPRPRKRLLSSLTQRELLLLLYGFQTSHILSHPILLLIALSSSSASSQQCHLARLQTDKCSF